MHPADGQEPGQRVVKARGFSLNRVAAVLIKEFKQLTRDRITYAMMLAIPVVQLTLFGYAINTEPRHLPTALFVQEGGRQVARLGVDRIAEQGELHDRDGQHHRVGDAVARELFELLDQHRRHAVQREPPGLHDTLSWLLPISWMHTSSSVGAASVQW